MKSKVMKSGFTSVVAGMMVAAMVICATPTGIMAASQSQVAGSLLITSAQTKQASVADTLVKDFKKRAKVDKKGKQKSASSIAKGLLKNDVIAFMGDTMAVEPGLLNGFDNAEIKGFKKGTMFAPMIGTMPFVAYVFEVKSESAGKKLVKTLKKNANLRWNICTEADDMKAVCVGKRVFFVMSPKQFEE